MERERDYERRSQERRPAPTNQVKHINIVKGAEMDATTKMPSLGPHTKEVLHQQGKLPFCLARMAVGGFPIVLTLGYFTLYSKKKPEATAIDVARVAPKPLPS